MIDAKSGFEKGKQTTSRRLIAMLSIGSLILSKEQLRLSNFCVGIGAKKKWSLRGNGATFNDCLPYENLEKLFLC